MTLGLTYKVHPTEEEFDFFWTADESEEIFQGKVDRANIIDQVNDEGHLRVLRGSSLLVNLRNSPSDIFTQIWLTWNSSNVDMMKVMVDMMTTVKLTSAAI